MNKVHISVFLDTRRMKANGKYPVKLRVFTSTPRIQKLYPTVFELSEKEFDSTWKTTKPRQEFKELRQKLNALELDVNRTIEKIHPFSFEKFESRYFGNHNSDYSNVLAVFDEIVSQKNAIGSISTAEKYLLAKRSLISFLEFSGKKKTSLSFDAITVQFLEKYSHYCQGIKGMSPATVGIYLRNLRSVYRIGVKQGTASLEYYPFTKENFSIPTSRKVNKSLSEEELKQLWKAQPANEKQALAKDFWFFSYYAYGMNTKDICELKHGSVSRSSFNYVRAKTKNTKKERTIKEVPLTPSLLEIIERRKNIGSDYLFGIISKADSPKERHEKIRNFNKYVNRYFREFALLAGIAPELANNLGTYHARHSFATIAIRKGTSTALISEILHDGNLKVTENYINSFPKETFRELSFEMDLG